MAMLVEDINLETQNLPELIEEQFEPEDSEEEQISEIESTGKDRKLVTHPYDFIIRSLKDQVDDQTLVLADKFQRRRVWDDTKSSRLIESLLLNVPIPVCYFAEMEDGSYSVIDGQQRLTAIYRYINNEFVLRSLKVRTDLNGKRFHQLGVTDQRLIKSRSIRCIVILKDSDPDIRFDVFDRLNSNSVRLKPQELRNSLYRGKLNDLIRELSENKLFQKIRGVKDVDKRMQDCEMVLRFFAFHFEPRQYRGYLSRFLDEYLRKGQNFNLETLNQHRTIFERVIQDVEYVFGEHSFRRYDRENQSWDRLINKSIYDVVMLYFAKLDSELIRQNKDEIIEAFKGICQNPAFNEAIASATSGLGRVQTRLDIWYKALIEIGLQVEQIKIGQYSGNES
jgi:uncharacterized protein with ParB-like and HNH nuclease domain